tara:strand:+ start:1823 stop:2452 length:630 start_codon:yes stop_codon:yes gene_type:complete
MEIYKHYIENYEVSNFGNIRRKLKNGYKSVAGSIQNRGYKYFQINRLNTRKNYLVHHMVAKLFIGDRPDKLVIDHIDRNKLNNNVSNLRYITQKENCCNTDRYVTEIKTTDLKQRNKELIKRNIKNIVDTKIFVCDSCPLITPLKGVFPCKRDYKNHIESSRHIWRCKIIELMKKNNIQINHNEFNSVKNAIYDFKRGQRKTKPFVWVD